MTFSIFIPNKNFVRFTGMLWALLFTNLFLQSILTAAPPAAPLPKQSTGPSPQNDAKNIDIIQSYSGICWMNPVIQMNAAKEQTDFPIYNQDDFDKFVGTIPATIPAKGGPESKNNDALLQKPKIDFKKEMVLVMIHPNSMSANPKVRTIREDAKTLWVELDRASNLGEAVPNGISAYTLVVIPSSGKMKTLHFNISGK